MNEITDIAPCSLRTISAKKLASTDLPPIKFYVDKLISQGVHILAGSPKAGKSWLTLWLCLQIANGHNVWKHPVTPCTVLYLSLEDSAARLQVRLKELTDEPPPNLHLATGANVLGEGLELQLEEFIASHPNTGVIAIDTLQKIRGDNANTQGNAYAGDYKALSALKAIADKHGIAILLIHHLRKSKSPDPFEQISGTTGITGAVDSSFILSWLNRSEGTARLVFSGRDIDYGEYLLALYDHIWEFIRESEGLFDSPCTEATVADFVSSVTTLVQANRGWKGTASELLLVTGCTSYSTNYITKLLKASKQQLEVKGITFRHGKANGKRFISFTVSDGAMLSVQEKNRVLEFPQREEEAPGIDRLGSARDSKDGQVGNASRPAMEYGVFAARTAPAVPTVTAADEDEKARMDSLLLSEPPMEDEQNDNDEEDITI